MTDAATCSGCGSSVAADFAFCPRCGRKQGSGGVQPSAAPPAAATDGGSLPRFRTEADRRLVTVLFADVSGFTAVSERLDPEVVRAFQTDLFGELSSVIEGHGGWVEKYVGDAVMAVFGAPVAHENDPERALGAALEMHRRMAALGQRWRSRLNGDVTLHVGVNTGLVVAGHLGGTSDGAYVVTGDTVNTTARLEAAAGPGQTLVSPSTYQLTRGAFRFEDPSLLAMKGKAEAVPVRALVDRARPEDTGRGAEPHGLDAPTVGREEEIERVWEAWERMLDGRAQIVSVVGEAGVGKSRVMEGFRERLRSTAGADGATVRWMTCRSFGERTYGVPATFLRKAYGLGPDDDVDEVLAKVGAGLETAGASAEERARITTVVGNVVGLDRGEARHLEPEQLRRQIDLALRTLAEIRVRRGPLVLVVEDFHFVDAASLEVLATTMDALHDRRVMLLVDFRPSFDPGALREGRAEYRTVRVGRLTEHDCARILDAFFGERPSGVPDDVRSSIIARAGGSPLYLREIVRSLIEEGALVRGPDGWACPDGLRAVDRLPPTVHSLVAARLDRLAPRARHHAQVAAVLGPEFRGDLLGRVSEEPGWRESLEALVDAELVEVGPAAPEGATHGDYRFTHTMVRQVAYESLLKSRRAELHGRIGRTLEALWHERGGAHRLEDLVTLCNHFSLSDDRRKGADYLMTAAERSAELYANDDAVGYLERALAILDDCEVDDAERIRPEEMLGDLRALRGERAEALRLYEVVRSRLVSIGRDADRARLLRKLGRLHWEAGDRARASSCFERGLGLLASEGAEIERARLFEEMGRLAFRSGDSESAAKWAEKSLAAIDAQGGVPRGPAPGSAGTEERAVAVSHAYNTLGISLARLGRLREAAEHLERSVAIAEGHGLVGAACRGLANLGVLYSTLDPRKAVETCLRGMEGAERIGDLGLQSCLQSNLAVAYCALTDRCEDEGLRAARAAVEIDLELGHRDHVAVSMIVLGQIHQCHGDPAVALRYYREALTVAEEIGEPQLLFPCYDGIATVHLDQGDMVGAEEYMRKCQTVCEEAGMEPEQLLVLPFLQ